jgi:type I restriction enzyme S subunit
LSYGKIVRKDINSDGGLLPESFDGYNIIQAGDTVLRLTDLQNDKRSLRTGLALENGIITSAYTTIRPTNVEPKWLSYTLHSYDIQKIFYSLGSGLRQSMNFSDLKNLPVYLPSIDEQRRIIEYLDKQTLIIDSSIALKNQQLSLLEKELLPSILEKAFSNLEGDQMQLCWLLSKKVHDGPHTTPEFTNNGVPFLSVDNISNFSIDWENTRFISQEENEVFSLKSRPQKGDILLTKSASIGKVALVDSEEVFNVWSPIAILRVNTEVMDNNFMAWQLLSPSVHAQMIGACTHSTQNNLAMKDIEKLKLIVPNLEVQKKLVETINSDVDFVNSKMLTLKNSIRLLTELKTALIAEGTSGQLSQTLKVGAHES